MAEDRPLELPEEAIGRLDAEFKDFQSTVLARLSRRPVGDVEPAFRPTPKPGTIFLQGQTLQRADYPALWAWAQEVGAVVAGGYGAGNGSTTFTVPDLRGRVLMGAGQLGADTYALGATVGSARHTLTEAEMPAHGHSGSAATAGNHSHDSANGQLDNNGGHGGHFPGTQFLAAAGADLGLAAWNSGGGTRGDHGHFFTFDIVSNGSHSHSVTINNTGGGAAHENRQPSLAVNWAVWT